MNTLFPVFLKTDQAHFLIIGGGNIGLEKATTLLRQNENVKITIVSESFKKELKELAAKHAHLKLVEKPYHKEDLSGIDYLIIATNQTEINTQIKKDANAVGLKVNAADQPDLCDFYLGSIVNKGNLKIAISTNGKSPVMARRLKEYFNEVIPETIDEIIENLNKIRNQHKGDFQTKLTHLNEVTSVLSGKKKKEPNRRLVKDITLIFFAAFVGYALSTVVSVEDLKGFVLNIPREFYIMLLVGFFAQIIDGAVGLGYGIVCSTSMMLFGVNLASISGSIHTAEMFSSGVSGYSHYKFGNVNKKLFRLLVIPGVIGAIAGSLLLIYLGDRFEDFAYVIVSTYTFIIGVRLIILALRKYIVKKKLKRTGLLGFAGGFFDAFGGGGWGPIVTSTLLSKGRKSRFVVGTVSLAEFFITLTASLVFFASLGVTHGYIIAGLIIGGVVAAPLAAMLAGKLPQKVAMLAVAALVIVSSLRIIFRFI